MDDMRGDPTACLILIVDDEQDVLQFAATSLKDFGYRTLTATSADEAIEHLNERSKEIDLVITDVRMPGEMDGAELAFTARSRWPTIGLIVLSGYFDPKASRLPMGCAFLAKPYRLSDLLLMVDQQLGFLNVAKPSSRTGLPATTA